MTHSYALSIYYINPNVIKTEYKAEANSNRKERFPLHLHSHAEDDSSCAGQESESLAPKDNGRETTIHI